MLTPTKFEEILKLLSASEIEFVLIGGVAAIFHGPARVTSDTDIVRGRSPANMRRLCQALAPYQHYLRGAPPGLPFTLDDKTVARGMNSTLTTTLGILALLGEATGGGTYEQLKNHAADGLVFGVMVKCVNLETLIHLKRSAGRAKDFEAIGELEFLRLRRDRPEPY